ncbi:heavy-metal-associated domain-containing protein [Bacteroidota bacterium]
MNKIFQKITVFTALFFAVFVLFAFANTNEKTVKIKTSAQCGMCKERIENHLSKQDGIIKAVLEVETAECTVKYDSTQITVDDIREEISSVGYDADEVKASKRTYKKLPKCCKKPEDR